jgi:hypothetical protein
MTTLYSSLLHTHTSVPSHVFTSCCSVAACNGGHSPSSGFPNYPRPQLPASHSNSSQRPNISCPLTHSLTHQPTTLHFTQLNWLHFTNYPAYNILAWIAQKTSVFCCCIQLLPWKHACLQSCYLVTAVVYLLISRSLPSNGSTCQIIFPLHPIDLFSLIICKSFWSCSDQKL